MNLSEHILLPREVRMGHTDLKGECVFLGIRDKPTTRRRARAALLGYLGLGADVTGHAVQCCHLCLNDNSSERVCVNPRHVYFGTPRENWVDGRVKAGAAVPDPRPDHDPRPGGRRWRARSVVVTEPGGDDVVYASAAEAAVAVGLSSRGLRQLITENRPSRGGYRARWQ